MKILKFLTFILFVGVFLVLSKDSALALNPYRKLCVGIQGKFSANSSWHGGNIQIGCGGDNGLAVPEARRSSEACLGEVQTIRPGQTFRLTMCSCFGSDNGCIKVGKNLNLGPLVDGKKKIIVVKSLKESEAFTARSCKVTDLSNKCGSNGKQITANIKITCNAASPTPKPSASPTPTISGAPSPSICPKPGKVTNVKITCPNCTSGNSSQSQNTNSGGVVSGEHSINLKTNDASIIANNAYVVLNGVKEYLDAPNLKTDQAEIYTDSNDNKILSFSPYWGNDKDLSFTFTYISDGKWRLTKLHFFDSNHEIDYSPTTAAGDAVENNSGNLYTKSGVTEFKSTSGGTSTVHFEDLNLGAFLNGAGN